MLTYEFMRIAFICALLLGISVPLVGSLAVYKRLSSSGDALAHASLAGVAIGLAAGLNPTIISIVACVIAFLIIELLRKRFSKYAELGVAVVLSAAIGLAGVLSSYASSYSFQKYLFGSILLISEEEVYFAIALAAVVLLFFVFLHRRIFACLYCEEEAKVMGIKVGLLNFAENLLLSITVALGTKIVGAMVISSLIVLPSAIALQFKKGIFWTSIIAEIVSVFSMGGGLTLAYYIADGEWAPGATIVLLMVAELMLAIVVLGVYRTLQRHHASHSASQS